MCLAVRGRILTIADQPAGAGQALDGPDDALWRMAEVDFGGVRHWVSLACLPDAREGDRVLVHVGLAIALVEDEEHDEDAEPRSPAAAGSRAAERPESGLGTAPAG